MNPRSPLPNRELENDVQRTVALLNDYTASVKAGESPKHEIVVILRALVISAEQKLAPKSAVDSILDGGKAPAATVAQQATGPLVAFADGFAHPMYGPPGKTRTPGAPSPEVFGPQSF